MTSNRTFLLIALSLLTLCAQRTSAQKNQTRSAQRSAGSAAQHYVPIYTRRHQGTTAAQRPPANRTFSAAGLFNLSSPPTSIGFFAAPQISAGGGPLAAVAGDFNGDGKKDVATLVSLSAGAYSVSVLLGNGDGSFQQPVLTPVTYQTYDRIYAADLNRDGKDDVLIVHAGSSGGFVEVLISNGDGTFATPVNYPNGVLCPAAVAVADIDGDSKTDLVIADATVVPGNPAPLVSTLLGNGDGTFGVPTQVSYAGPVENAVFADVNGDGKLDLVSSSQVFLANPAGGYQSGIPLSLSGGGVNTCAEMDGVVATADVNGDGKLDVISAGCQTNTVMIFLGNGDGTFQPGTSVWAGFYPVAISVADVNGDSKPDILSSNAYASDVSVLLGNGDGTFQTPAVGYALGGVFWTKPVLADFNGDGKPDIIAPQFVPDYESGLTYLQGAGDGTFVAARDYYQPLSAGTAYGIGVVSADFNADSIPDLVLGASAFGADIGVTVFLSNSDGTLKPGVNYGTGGNLNFVATGDFNSDGKQDIVAADAHSGDVELFLGNGDGTLQTAQTFAGAQGASAGITVGDFNGDGKPDVALVGSPSSVFVLLNDAVGRFQTPVSYSITSEGWEITAADLNKDGKLDLAVTQTGSNFVSILLGKGDGTFLAASDFDLGSSWPAGIAAGDLNKDGNNDLAVAIDDVDTGMGIAVALGNGDGTFQPATLYPTSSQTIADPYPGEVEIIDVDKDGNLDMVYTNSEYGTVGVLYGKGDGTFYTPVDFPAGIYGYGLTVADINGDGAVDVVTGNDGFPGLTVSFNTGGNNTTLTSSPNPSSYGEPVTVTATVAATVRGVNAVPSGTMSFTDNGTPVGSASVGSAGRASLVLPALSVGSHVFSAAYSGDSAFLPSTSPTLTQSVTSVGAPDYTLTANPTSATIQPGQSAVFTITATSVNDFNGTVDFACGVLPQGVSCQFAPASVTLTAGQSASIQLTVSAAANALASASPVSRDSGHMLPLWFSLSGGVFGWILIEGLDAQRRRRLIVLLAVIALAASILLTGCGSRSTAGGSPQTVQVTVNAIANGGGANTYPHQINITVIIQQ